MAAGQFCLKWNNFHNSIVSAFESLQSLEELVDVTLMCEGHNVKAHKVILSACSPYFRNLFKVSNYCYIHVHICSTFIVSATALSNTFICQSIQNGFFIYLFSVNI